MIDGKFYQAINFACQPNGDIVITARPVENLAPVASEPGGTVGYCMPSITHADGTAEGVPLCQS